MIYYIANSCRVDYGNLILFVMSGLDFSVFL
jgi:hypothetical protein